MHAVRRAMLATILVSVVALIVAACGDAVTNNPKAALADAFEDFGAAESAGATVSLQAPDFDRDVAVRHRDIDETTADVWRLLVDDVAIRTRWNHVDDTLSPREQMRQTAVDFSFVHAGDTLLRYRMVDERLFVAADVHELAELIAPYAGPGVDARMLVDELTFAGTQWLGAELVDHVVHGGWLELVDLLAFDDIDEPDEADEEQMRDIFGSFVRDEVEVTHGEGDDPHRLRVSTTTTALIELWEAIEASELIDEDLWSTDLGDVPDELRGADVWVDVLLDDGRLVAVDVPIGELAQYYGDVAELDAAEQDDLEVMRAIGLDTLSLMIEFDRHAPRVSPPDDAFELDLDELLEQLFVTGLATGKPGPASAS
jgi:hypothetical protein